MDVQDFWLGLAVLCSTAYIVFRALDYVEGDDDGK